MTELDDVRLLVNKLYAALHVDEHQIGRERDLLQEIEDTRAQLMPMEKVGWGCGVVCGMLWVWDGVG